MKDESIGEPPSRRLNGRRPAALRQVAARDAVTPAGGDAGAPLRRLATKDEILSGELAKMCGVSPDTIRHYERVGVLPAAVRGENGYRRFPREAAGRVLLIRRALAIGFSLGEVARILRQRDGGAPPCRNVRALAGEKLEALDRRIAKMTAAREDLAKLLEEWDARLAATRDGEEARLLEQPGSTPAPCPLPTSKEG